MSKCNAWLGGILVDCAQNHLDVCCGSQWPGNMRKTFSLSQFEEMQQHRLQSWNSSQSQWQMGCGSCKLSEQIKKESSRHKFNRLVDIANDPIDTSIQQATIRTGNICNLKCTMCGPELSTKWSSFIVNADFDNEFSKKYKLKVKQDRTTQKEFVDFVKQKVINKNLKRLEFTGGEPLYNKSTYEILEYVLQTGFYKNLESFKVQTNGTTKFNDTMKDFLKHYKGDISISISADGTHEVFEYIRRDHSWDKFVDVVSSMKKDLDNRDIDYSLKVAYMLQAINSKSFIQDINFYKNWDLLNDSDPFHYDTVHGPEHLSLSSVPDDLKIKWKCPVENFEYNQNLHADMIEYYDAIDKADSHPSWRNFIPELER